MFASPSGPKSSKVFFVNNEEDFDTTFVTTESSSLISDGSEHQISEFSMLGEEPERVPVWKRAWMNLFPCFSGKLWTKDKKEEYRKAAKTVTVLISLVQVIMFVVGLGLGGIESPARNWLIGPGADTWITLGAKYAYLIKRGQLQRLFAPIFLHSGFIQIFINLYGQIRMGLFLERSWGWYRLACIYFFGGIGGILFSCIIQTETIGCGAGASLMAILGAYGAQLIMTFHRLDSQQLLADCFLSSALVCVTMIEGIAPFHAYVDFTAHLSSLVIGFVLSIFIFGKDFGRSDSFFSKRRTRILAFFSIFLYFIGAFVVFFGFIDPLRVQDDL